MLKNGFSYAFIQKIAVLYLVVWTVSPPLQVDMIYRLIALACAGVWFILWFILAIIANTYLLDSVPEVGRVVSGFSRKLLTLTMFFIGSSLSKETIQAVGIRPMIQGVILWIIISVGSLLYIIC